MSKPDSIIFFRPVCRICTATIPWQHARATSSAKTAHHPKNMAANSEPMGRKMKLSPPTTKTNLNDISPYYIDTLGPGTISNDFNFS
jgi:hypothetical protein